MATVQLICPHCQTTNTVATCPSCSRAFVITAAHIAGQPRQFDSVAVASVPADFHVPHCDFCQAQQRHDALGAVEGGMRQRTCPHCHTEFLSAHGRSR